MKSHHKKKTVSIILEKTETLNENQALEQDLYENGSNEPDLIGQKSIFTQKVQYYVAIIFFACIVCLSLLIVFAFIKNY